MTTQTSLPAPPFQVCGVGGDPLDAAFCYLAKGPNRMQLIPFDSKSGGCFIYNTGTTPPSLSPNGNDGVICDLVLGQAGFGRIFMGENPTGSGLSDPKGLIQENIYQNDYIWLLIRNYQFISPASTSLTFDLASTMYNTPDVPSNTTFRIIYNTYVQWIYTSSDVAQEKIKTYADINWGKK